MREIIMREILLKYYNLSNIELTFASIHIFDTIIKRFEKNDSDILTIYRVDKKEFISFSSCKYIIEDEYFNIYGSYHGFNSPHIFSHKDYIIMDKDYIIKMVRDNSLKSLLC